MPVSVHVRVGKQGRVRLRLSLSPTSICAVCLSLSLVFASPSARPSRERALVYTRWKMAQALAVLAA